MTDLLPPRSTASRIRFGRFELEMDTGVLHRAGVALKLQPRPASMLCLLASQPGKLVSREEIQRHLWGNRAVEADHGINTCVRQIRAALNDPADTPAYVETVPRKGYRFIAPVTEVGQQTEPEPIASGPRLWPRAAAVALPLIAVLLLSTVWITGAKDRVTVAVLPFQNLTGDPDTEFFAAGVTEEIITELTKLDPTSLGVIARTSTLRFSDQSSALDSVAILLSADYVVQGSVRRDAEGVRVTTQLVRVSDKTQAWADRYDHENAPALTVSALVAKHVATALVPNLLPSSKPDPVISDNSPAREYVLRGRYVLSKRTPESIEQAQQLFHIAIERDSTYAPAFLGLADALYNQNDKAPSARMPEAQRYARRAASLDDGLAGAYLRLGAIALYYDWNFDGAFRALTRAAELAPGAAEPPRLLADYYTARGDHTRAIESVRLAAARDPLAPGLMADVGMTYYAAREYSRSLEQCQTAQSVEPRHPAVLDCFLRVHRVLGQDEAAIPWARKIMHLFGDSIAADSMDLSSTPARSLTIFDEWMAKGLEEWANDRYVSPFLLAIVDTHRGQRTAALEHLARGVTERDRWMIFLDAEPRLDTLRADPVFENVRKTVGIDRS